MIFLKNLGGPRAPQLIYWGPRGPPMYIYIYIYVCVYIYMYILEVKMAKLRVQMEVKAAKLGARTPKMKPKRVNLMANQ